MKLQLKNVTTSTIDFTRRHIGFYDVVCLGGLLMAFILEGHSLSNLFLGVSIYGLLNAIVKNARPKLTLLVTYKGAEIIDADVVVDTK